MPTCPGCQQRVSYERLDTHERYCHGIHGSDDTGRRATRRLEERMEELEDRLERRVQALEVRSHGRTIPGDDEATRKLLEGDW